MASKGWGAQVQYGNAATYAGSTTWTAVAAEIIEISPPAIEAEKIRTSHMLSTSQYNTYTGGWADTGDCEVTAYYTETEYAALLALFRSEKGWRVLFEDASGATTDSAIGFTGFLSGLGTPVDMDGLIEMTITITVSGPLTHDLDAGA